MGISPVSSSSDWWYSQDCLNAEKQTTGQQIGIDSQNQKTNHDENTTINNMSSGG